jgi:hypothetical protein
LELMKLRVGSIDEKVRSKLVVLYEIEVECGVVVGVVVDRVDVGKKPLWMSDEVLITYGRIEEHSLRKMW